MPRRAATVERRQVVSLLPAGTIIVEFHIPHRAAPWTAAFVGKNGAFKDKRITAWQKTVKQYARLAMGNRAPYGGEVEIQLWFRLTPLLNKSVPDWCNLAKGTEDALQGIVIVNDRQVVEAYVKRIIADEDRVSIRVVAKGEGS